jgi:hypothetical protein
MLLGAREVATVLDWKGNARFLDSQCFLAALLADFVGQTPPSVGTISCGPVQQLS